MRIFKNKLFNKWARGEGLTAEDLREVANEMAVGDTGVSLGGKVFKKRVALSGRGKRGGARIIIGFKFGGNVFFIYGFAKNKRGNIDNDELKALRKLAKTYSTYTDKELDVAVGEKALIEIEVKYYG